MCSFYCGRHFGREVSHGQKEYIKAGDLHDLPMVAHLLPHLHVEDDGLGLDVDPEDVRAYIERHTCVEMGTEGPDRHIVIPMDYNLLANCKQETSALAPLCVASESAMLKVMSDVELSRSTFGMALRVSNFFFFCFCF